MVHTGAVHLTRFRWPLIAQLVAPVLQVTDVESWLVSARPMLVPFDFFWTDGVFAVKPVHDMIRVGTARI